MRKKIKQLLAVIASTSLLFTACGQKADISEQKNSNIQSENKIKIITSIYPMYDFAKKIAGDKADIENIIPAGTEAHGWEPSATDIAKLEEADIFIYNGLDMEGWTDKVLSSLSNKNLLVVEASNGCYLIKNDEHNHEEDEHHHEHEHTGAHSHGEYDPHVWLSIKNAKIQMENIKNALVVSDPDNKDYYEENYEKYTNEFDELDKLFADTLSPYKGNSIVVAHEAFAYIGKDYGINQFAIEGVYKDSEPDPVRMREVIEFVKENNIKVIFFESFESPEVSETIANETQTTTDMLNPLESLSKDDMDSGYEYISVMKKNLESIVKSFE